MKRVRIKARGRVQGVGFRWFVKQTAERYEVTGWVENQWDGSVLMEVQGSSDVLMHLLKAIQHEHSYARVDSITTSDLPLAEYEKTFYIRG